MSTSKIINDFNKCLLREKFYDYKYNLNNFMKKPNDIKTLFDTIKNNKSDNEFYEFSSNDSITTTEALNNLHLKKLSGCLKNITRNKNYKFYTERMQSSRKKDYNIKALDIKKYSDCVRVSQKRNKTRDAILIPKINFLYINRIKNEMKTINRKRPLTTKIKNDLHQRSKTINHEVNKDNDIHLNIYNNNKFKDCLSSFLYHVNNITAYQKENEKSDEDFLKNNGIKFYNKEISKYFQRKNINKKEIKEIKRFEVDVSNIFLIQKPLITSIRGKILKNTKKRFKRPVRNIIKSTIFYNYKDD